MSQGEIDNFPRNWEDDLLDRRRYADFLTNFIDNKVDVNQPGMVMALDAPWGLGKTFFITRWAKQLRETHHAVVVFDAWQNDSSENAVVSFMAELRAGLKPTIDSLRLDTATEIAIKSKSKDLTNKLRRATWSTAKVVGTGVLKKATGIAIQDLVGALNDDDENSDANELEIDPPSDQAVERHVIEKGLDEFFEKSLQSHSEKMQAIADFRRSLQDLLADLRKANAMSGPLYVFIDELDRCRPNYAIHLLEGIKHLFSVQGVAFVVSTNLDQLSKAMGAVYGSSFDGFLYLKRFFDFEYELPEPTRVNFIKSQTSNTNLAKLSYHSGLDTRSSGSSTSPIDGFAVIGEAMRLDLRSLDRILKSADAVVANIPQNTSVASLWLFFLAALRYRHQDAFRSVGAHNLNVSQFKELCSKVFTGPSTVAGLTLDASEPYHRARTETFSLADVLAVYYHATIEKSDWILKAQSEKDLSMAPYPEFLISTLSDGWPTLNRRKVHPIDGYAELISMAGHVVK